MFFLNHWFFYAKSKTLSTFDLLPPSDRFTILLYCPFITKKVGIAWILYTYASALHLSTSIFINGTPEDFDF